MSKSKSNKSSTKSKSSSDQLKSQNIQRNENLPDTIVYGGTSTGSASSSIQQSSLEVVATVVINGVETPLDSAGFGKYVLDNYQTLFFMWIDDFEKYHNTHIMQDVLTKLKSGMDEVSCYNIDHHEMLVKAAAAKQNSLFKKDLLLNEIDRKLIERYDEMKASGQYPLLDQVNLEWGTCFTNFYGMYDTDTEILKKINGKDIIDVGAFIGDSLSLFRALFNDSKVYAFEPSSNNIEQLKTYFKNDIESGIVIPVNSGCGKEKSKLKLSKYQGEVDAMASLQYDYQGTLYEEVDIIKLDDYAKEHNLDVGLIKIDVEGFEPDVIEGTLNIIKEQRPILLIAFYHTPYEFYELKSYLESLNLNYHFEVRRSCISSPLVDLVLVCTPM